MKVYYLEKMVNSTKMYWCGKHKWTKIKRPKLFKSMADPQPLDINWDHVHSNHDLRNCIIKGFELDLDIIDHKFEESSSLHDGRLPDHAMKWKRKLINA